MEAIHDGFGIWRSMGKEKPKENGDYLLNPEMAGV